MPELTIAELVRRAWETSDANGWHEDGGARVVAGAPKAQLAALAPVVIAFAKVIEAVRKPEHSDVEGALQELAVEADHLSILEPCGAVEELPDLGQPLVGSAAEVKARLVLVVSEVAEAIEALDNGDAANFAEELADIMLRLGDLVGSWNKVPGREPIDLEREIIGKDSVNRQRGHRHGGKAV